MKKFQLAATPSLLALALVAPACGDEGTNAATEQTSSDTGEPGTTAGTESTGPTTGPSGSDSDASDASSDPSDPATSDPTDPSTTDPTDPSTTDPSTTDPTDPATTDPATTDPSTTGLTDTDTGGGCGVCNEPNEMCVDGECVTTCQGQDPDPCAPDQVCDVISGECKDPMAMCTVAGPYLSCGGQSCGPGTVCDGEGTCVAVAPCASVSCTGEGVCWGAFCSCTREYECPADPDLAALNGPFSTDIFDLEFADDCTAWMVTLRSGPDYLRRLETDGTLTQWTGIANLNMGEVKVLKALHVPAELKGGVDQLVEPPAPQEDMHLGEVALTYTCCATCGCQVDPPQGVARLVEDDMQNPLPLVIEATVTQGSGPFANTAADAGPMGLTWGEDLVLYVGNSSQNGDLNSADLEAQSQEVLAPMPDRIHAAAAVSPAHLLVAIEGGDLYLYTIPTQKFDFVVDLGADVTSLSHDSFSGLVYAGLQTLEVVEVRPFTGDVASFDTMPGKGRVTVSPDGRLFFVPARYVQNGTISAWDLPDTL